MELGSRVLRDVVNKMSFVEQLIKTANTLRSANRFVPQAILSPGVLGKLRDEQSSFELRRYDGPATIFGADIIESPFQLKRRKLVSLDRFCEYDDRDAEWAVPLGLAKWVEIDVDAIVTDRLRSVSVELMMNTDPDCYSKACAAYV